MKIKIAIAALIFGLAAIACPTLYFVIGPKLTDLQLETVMILLIICATSFLYCFIVGEITRNNSQMDKLWSILPEVYAWVVAIKGGMKPRLVLMAILATIWGIRLTINFAKKGAYKLKFWEGEEDYRWEILRKSKFFQARWKWVLFDLFFISFYQNVLVLLTVVPAVAVMESEVVFHWMDIVAAVLMIGFILLETIADKQQWDFQSKKYAMLKEGKKLEELPAPYNKGFNTTGLWGHTRHPNYLGEQGTWVSFFLFTIGAGLPFFNWSAFGAMLLILLFLGSSTMAEKISGSKYPEYALYTKKTTRYFPWKKYQG